MESQRQASELAAEESSPEGVDMDRMPATFYPDTKEEDIVTMLYPDFTTDKQRLEALDDATERAEGLSGLELMLADSIRGEMVRQAAILELDPQQGEQVLPKIERLRMIRQDHLQQAERITAEHEATLVAANAPSETLRSEAGVTQRIVHPVGQDPVADRFVSLDPDPERIYASKIVHRSSKVDDAVAFKEADLARIDLLDERMDSIQKGMNGLSTREYEKQQKNVDKLADERMIIRSDMGQRSEIGRASCRERV